MFANIRLYVLWRFPGYEEEFTALYFNLDDARFNNDMILSHMAQVQIRSQYGLSGNKQFTFFRIREKHRLEGPYSIRIETNQTYRFPIGVQSVAISKFSGHTPNDINMNIHFVGTGFDEVFNPSDHTTAMQNGRVLELLPPIYFPNAQDITINVEFRVDPVSCSMIFQQAIPITIRRDY